MKDLVGLLHRMDRAEKIERGLLPKPGAIDVPKNMERTLGGGTRPPASTYESDKPCVNCGSTERYMGGQCAPCQRARVAKSRNKARTT